jgi:putative tryptophan/tyrosine transport system substrate-binding protein
MWYSAVGGIVTLLLGLLVAPLAGGAQPPGKVPRIGLLEDSLYWEAFRQGLRDLGYIEGQNIRLEARLPAGQPERLPALAAELVQLPVDIIVASGSPGTQAAQQATSTIPIVMASVGDPVGSGFVASLAQPGGNITGLSVLGAGLSTKRLELLHEIVPTLSRLAVLWNPANPNQRAHVDALQVGVRALGVALQSVEVRTPDEFDSAFTALTRERPDALYLTADSMHQRYIERIIAFAATSGLPAMYQVPGNVRAGGLMAYGASVPALFRRAAYYVDKVLKGAKPGDLPVEQPTKFELIINLKAAKALGLTIPPSLLLQADEVIK